jgi:hypothetical protein
MSGALQSAVVQEGLKLDLLSNFEVSNVPGEGNPFADVNIWRPICKPL